MSARNDEAGAAVTYPGPEPEEQRREDSTAPRGSLQEVAGRLFPPPDPVNFCKREAIARLDASDRALQKALVLRETADPILFDDLGRLWIHPGRAETLLAAELAELRKAVAELADGLDLLASARGENALRFYDERIRERPERKA